MRIIGLDLGSRRTKAAYFIDGQIWETAIFDSWPLSQAEILKWVEGRPRDNAACTGYGRRLAADKLKCKIITEISAFSLGANILAPDAATIIDIGGQDSKVIKREKNGEIGDFEMNDRCAAGTGKFFELIARTLGISFDELVISALNSNEVVPISSVCAVFAESEIIGKLAEGAARADIARGIFNSVAQRIHAMVRRIAGLGPFILVGGGANLALSRELESFLKSPIFLPERGSFFGAVGAALSALK
ncbi:MAG: 3-hydroxyacyl-ACP dehydratase [Candidatus Riflebacteria bacterium]|nr:3-hydroxyacyl-ACP dehydratase [Candidatus Riflebacteria bacterium]